ncbi:class I adenylate-forming enzyme family protein [Arthrobacter sp. SO3]|uniref:class I adenylate-forming enzyme family protein n=1 Tax=Arthrobacter sp. SO3 TaxID=1897057 RepID=UPI001CFF9380|nr:AMP-binding protein [Arthrobacter sp. SO3]MCB5293586.1 Long-chain-fatty-acid--CoA ligase [Arthrobacter sp. SO3]
MSNTTGPGRADGLHTLGRWTTDRSLATPQRIAVDDRGCTLSYGELERRAAGLAAALKAAGYATGDRIATLTGNSSDHVVAFFACAKAGLVLVPLSWRLSAKELAAQLELADPQLLLVEDELDSLAAAACTQLAHRPRTAALGPGGIEKSVPPPSRRLPSAVPGMVTCRAEAHLQEAAREVRDDDPLLMIFTSGTEGASKAAVLTHANCFWTNLSLSRTMDLGSTDVVLAVLPQFHVGGWNIQPLLAWWTGATVVLERGFEPGRVLQLIAERGVTMLMGVPTQYLMLAEHPDFASAELGSLRHAVVGGAPMPAPLLRIWHRRGVALSQGYGLTEASPNVLCLANEDAVRMVGYSGKPYPHVAVAVSDPVTGEILDGAASGELLVGGPGVFAGYFRDPAATAAVLVGGWLRTGDLVERDAEGYIRVVDRLKDIYISGGENVAPAEVEAVLLAHPAVAQAAVVGVEDGRWGETGVAFVVIRPGVATDEQELLEHCASQLAHFKVPSRIETVAALPRTALNKVLRARLRQQLDGPTPDGPTPDGPHENAAAALPGTLPTSGSRR